jgi:hypothetical protein
MFGRSTLARFVTRVGLVNDVYLATTADNLTVRVTLLGGFDGGDDFHKINGRKHRSPRLLSNEIWEKRGKRERGSEGMRKEGMRE